MWHISSGIYLGWSLGANDAANVFGTAVSSGMVRFRTAAILSAIFIILGAMLQGASGFHTLGSITTQSILQAFICSLAAAVTATIMTLFELPISTSQAVVGAIIGVGLCGSGVNWQPLIKVVICWIGTPVGAAVVAVLLYNTLSFILNKLNLDFYQFDFVMRAGLILTGIYGAYALGANNVANVTGIYVGAGLVDGFQAALIGSVSIAIGVVTFSKNVMITVGRKLVRLDAFTALVAVLSESLTVHFYAIVGVPVSTSQAIIGAIFGIGLLKGVKTVNPITLIKIIIGWILTPVLSAGVAIIILKLSQSF